MTKIKLRVGDTVLVRTGKDRGKTGKVLAVHPTDNKVTVEGVNVFKKNKKPTTLNPKGETVEITKPIWVSKVGLVHPSDKNKTTKIGIKVGKDGKKTRIARATGKEIK